MRVSTSLFQAFGADFERLLFQAAQSAGLVDELAELTSDRFLNRSLAPHILKLSELFNRLGEESLDSYWKKGSNPKNLRLAYFLYFLPCNLFRMAAVWGELHRWGYQFDKKNQFKMLDFGSGPGAASSGIALGEAFHALGVPKEAEIHLIEKDAQHLKLAQTWLNLLFESQLANGASSGWQTKLIHQRIDFTKLWLPKSAPSYSLITFSFTLNEQQDSPQAWARGLHQMLRHHLEKEGLVIFLEPALKAESRRLLELRKEFLALDARSDYQVLFPCLGKQGCGALEDAKDWCHEEVTWWRPPIVQKLDKICELDRKSLNFSYWVIAKSKKPLAELLPELPQGPFDRLVSPAFKAGRNLQFYTCSEQNGKKLSRVGPADQAQGLSYLRGDLVENFTPQMGRLQSDQSKSPDGE